jgi:hypothetical protein
VPGLGDDELPRNPSGKLVLGVRLTKRVVGQVGNVNAKGSEWNAEELGNGVLSHWLSCVPAREKAE